MSMKGSIDPSSEVRDFLDKMPLFSNLSTASLQALANSSKFMQVEKGHSFFTNLTPLRNATLSAQA